MQQINLNDKAAWTDDDIKKARIIFNNPEITATDLITAWETNEIIRVADAGDYEYLYGDFIQNESGYGETACELSFDEFMTELKKGYHGSGCVQVARLFELSNGVWYDNEYV